MISIHTLGEFDIRINNKSILASIGYSFKSLRLFKYFLTFHGQKLLPYKVIGDFYMDEEYSEPVNVLRTQISRVRNIIAWNEYGIKPFFTIESVGGYYTMKLTKDCWVDFIEFERFMGAGENLLTTDENQGMEHLKAGLDLYKGEYLSELVDEAWVVPIQSRYDRTYINSIDAYFKVLSKKGLYNRIIEMSEKAIQIKPHDEAINISFIKALMGIDDYRYANDHYQYFSTKLYNDLGLAPTETMKELYKRLKSGKVDASDAIMNPGKLEKTLVEGLTYKGVTVCDKDHFRFLHNLEKKNKGRSERDAFVGLVTVDSKGPISLTMEEAEKGMENLWKVIYSNLRRGDVAAKWNDSQVAVMLYGLREEHLNIITQRLKNSFHQEMDDNKTTINMKYIPIE